MKTLFPLSFASLLFLAPFLAAGAATPDKISLAPILINKAAFAKAAAEAEKIEDDAEAEQYLTDKFYPYFGPHYASVMSDCFKTVRHPSMKPFSFIMKLDKSGHVTEVDLAWHNSIAECLVQTLSVDQFPAPPFTPFTERMDMTVTHEDAKEKK